MTSVKEWLELENPSKNSINLEPAMICFERLANAEEVKKILGAKPPASKAPSATLKILFPKKGLNHDYAVIPQSPDLF